MSKKIQDRFMNNPDKRMVDTLDGYLGQTVAIMFRGDQIVAPDGTGATLKGILHANADAADGQYMLIVDQGGDQGVVAYEFDISKVAAVVTPVPRQVYAQWLAEAKAKETELAKELDEMLQERIAAIDLEKKKILH